MSDYNLFLDAVGSCPGAPGVDPGADLDRDGCVTLADFQIWRNCYQFQGNGCTRDSFDPPCGWGLLDYLFGTDAPPSSLCGLEMSPFPPDEAAAYGLSTHPRRAWFRDEIGFSPAVSHRRIGSGWMSWSHGYTGDVYYTNGASALP